MGAGSMSEAMDRRLLETWLRDTMTPVEPSARFIRRLRAGLVSYQGAGLILEWKVVAAVVALILVTAASLGLTLRIILAVLSVFGVIHRTRRRDQDSLPA
jgi:hypothetical protein